MRSIWQNFILAGLRPLRTVPTEFRGWLSAAARGGRSSRILWIVVAGVVWLLLASGLVTLSSHLVHVHLWDVRAESLEEISGDFEGDELRVYVGAWAACVLLAALALVPARLLWLRFGAKRALRSRERCAFCGHGLAGVPVGTDALVTCPECSRTTPAMGAWNEIDASSTQHVFRPAAGLLPRFWTRRRVILAAKAGGAAIGLALLAYAGWWSIREVGIRREAAIARSERVGGEALRAQYRADHPAPPAGTVLIEDLVDQINQKARATHTAFVSSLTAQGEPDNLYPDPTYITAHAATEEENFEKKLRYSRDLMELYRKDGIYADLNQLAGANPWSAREVFTIDEDLPQNQPVLRGSRALLSISVARMRLAVEARDLQEFVAASNTAVALAATAYDGPFLIDWLVASAAFDTILREWSHAVAHWQNPALSDHIESRLRDVPAAPPTPHLQRERLLVLDSLAWYFSEPSRVRKGLAAPELEDKFGIGGEFQSLMAAFGIASEEEATRLGTYSENRDAMSAVMTWLGERARLEPWQRPDSEAPDSQRLAIVVHTGGPLTYIVSRNDQRMLRHRSLEVMLALEKHRIAHAAYPASLAELAPRAVVLDPFSGKPFGYRRIDASTDAHQRGYLLWTVGADGIDNDGAAHTAGDLSLRKAGAGFDFILNSPKW